MGKLTVKKVDALSEPGRYSDGDGFGFHLRIDPQGRKYWVLRVHDAGGKRKDVSLGSARLITLSAAREKARKIREQVESSGGEVAAVPTFAEAAKLAHRARTEGYRNGKHITQWLSTLQQFAVPAMTASRPGNISLAKRSQMDLEEGVWSIPAEEMKAGEPHRVPLSSQAVEIVRSAMAMHEHDLLFTMSGDAISPDTLRMMMRRMGRTETPHGFRSTFKEWARAAGWADHLSEAALAHQDPNEVRAAYARSDQLEERAPMMAAWASYLEGRAHNP